MSLVQLENINVSSQDVLITPDILKKDIPLTTGAAKTVESGRVTIKNILDRKDHRLLVVVGPCSIHDIDAAKDYAQRLKAFSEQVSDTLLLAMRVYFEKPRTTTGWKGLINDPDLNDSFDLEKGLHLGRKLLVNIAEMGLPAATEALDPISPQYLQDTIAWSAIGARTTESQTHREMSSGLSMPIGFKNGTDGSLNVAINAMKSVASPHSFLGINHSGQVAIIRTKGNQYGHVVLRGGGGKPNFDSVNIRTCEQELAKASLRNAIIVDCSHENSSKNPDNQPLVLHDVSQQIREGNQSILGVMIESNINRGNQPIVEDRSKLRYGVSVTDACIDWETTKKSLLEMRDHIQKVLPERLK